MLLRYGKHINYLATTFSFSYILWLPTFRNIA